MFTQHFVPIALSGTRQSHTLTLGSDQKAYRYLQHQPLVPLTALV